MKDRFKFRAWDKRSKSMLKDYFISMFPIQQWVKHGWLVEQCTGLKDNKGKLIYEGDILDDNRQKVVIKWSEETAQFVCCELVNSNLFVEGVCDFLYVGSPYKIIGNIHENPELLER